jgi:hypothetical protein
MFIEKLPRTVNLNRLLDEIKNIVDSTGWGHTNQIGLKSRPDSINKWFDSSGSLYDKDKMVKISNEWDFSEWNLGVTSYIRQQIELLELNEGFKSGRVRIMRLLPHTGLSVHRDSEVRYHLVLKTNKNSYIAENINAVSDSDLPSVANCYHIPLDSNWYKVDTTKFHWVYNGGDDSRIHLVVCGQS